MHVVTIGMLGAPSDWMPFIDRLEKVCRFMLLPFDPEAETNEYGVAPEDDVTMANVTEYVETGAYLRDAGVVKNQPEIVFLIPGVSTRGRLRALTSFLPEKLQEHTFDLLLLHFESEDYNNELFTELMTADMSGTSTLSVGPGADVDAFEKEVAQWFLSVQEEPPD